MNFGKQFKEGLITNNPVLVQVLGMCSTMAITTSFMNGLGMGVAVTFVMALASMVTWAVDHYILTPLDLGYMQTAAFILIIAAIVQVVEMFLKKSVPTLYQALGIYLPLITTNCAVLGVALLNIQEHYNFLESLVYGFTGGLGFILAIVLFSAVRQRVEEAECPESFQGFPIALISAGLLALAFMGFSGLKIF